MKPLTTKQQSLLDAIKKFIADNGFAPSQPELQRICGYKHNCSIVDKLNAIEAKGFISRLAFMPRSIVVNVL